MRASWFISTMWRHHHLHEIWLQWEDSLSKNVYMEHAFACVQQQISWQVVDGESVASTIIFKECVKLCNEGRIVSPWSPIGCISILKDVSCKIVYTMVEKTAVIFNAYGHFVGEYSWDKIYPLLIWVQFCIGNYVGCAMKWSLWGACSCLPITTFLTRDCHKTLYSTTLFKKCAGKTTWWTKHYILKAYLHVVCPLYTLINWFVDVAVNVITGAWGWSSEALELHVESWRVRPSYGQGRYGVVPLRAPNIVAISFLQIRLPHHTIGRRRFPPNAASVKEQGDDHCGNEPSRCLQSWQRTFWSAHLGEMCTPPSAVRVGWEGATGAVDESSPCCLFECVVGVSRCSTQFSLLVS